jgi:hypothetical protein
MPAAGASPIVYTTAPAFSWGIFLLLLLLLGLAVWAYRAVVLRCTVDRRWIALMEWARDHGFRRRPVHLAELPPPIAILPATIRLNLTDARASLLQMDQGNAQWNLLIRKISSEWIPSGLRPAKQAASVLDELQLSTYPAYSSAERFHLISADTAAARRLSKSTVRALLPADIGLLLWGNWMILDFTQRPFDPIEFGRMIALADQVAGMLP